MNLINWPAAMAILSEAAMKLVRWRWNWLPHWLVLVFLMVPVFVISTRLDQGVSSWLASAGLLLAIGWMIHLIRLSYRRQKQFSVMPFYFGLTLTVWELLREEYYHARFWSDYWWVVLLSSLMLLLGGWLWWRERKWHWSA